MAADAAEVRGEWFAATCRRRLRDFTRRREMGCAEVFGAIVARRGRSLKMELRELGRRHGMHISAPGFLKARERPDPAAATSLPEGGLRARFATVAVAGREECLVTNVPVSELPRGELGGVYRARRGIEACFQMVKDRLQMESFTGGKPVLIERDIHATSYLLNSTSQTRRTWGFPSPPGPTA